VTPDTRFSAGIAVQKSIFGAGIDKMRQEAPKGQVQFQDFLSDNCFGDYYTRDGLDLKTREQITFTAILSMGGAEPQLKAHIKANAAVGTTKQELIGIVTCLVPFIGYPRSLNAVACINEMLPVSSR
jgi:4-carboxymuconolactone decarboxylase